MMYEILVRFLPLKPALRAVVSHSGHDVGRDASAGLAVVRMAAVNIATRQRLIALTC